MLARALRPVALRQRDRIAAVILAILLHRGARITQQIHDTDEKIAVRNARIAVVALVFTKVECAPRLEGAATAREHDRDVVLCMAFRPTNL